MQKRSPKEHETISGCNSECLGTAECRCRLTSHAAPEVPAFPYLIVHSFASQMLCGSGIRMVENIETRFTEHVLLGRKAWGAWIESQWVLIRLVRHRHDSIIPLWRRQTLLFVKDDF